MLMKRFVENGQPMMDLRPVAFHSLEAAFHNALFFATKHPCTMYRLHLPRKTIAFDQHATLETLQKTYQQLTKEEYRHLEFDVTPFEQTDWSNEDKGELHAFLFDLALLTHNIPWAHDLYQENH